MAKPASIDLRKRVVLAVLAGGSSREVADRFGVAPSSPSKWTQHYRETGSYEAGKMGGHRPRLLEAHEDFILKRIAETSHVTVRGLRDELAERGVVVCHDTIWRFLRARGLTHKKACLPMSNAAMTSCAGATDGAMFKTVSRQKDSYSLMKRGSKPAWRHCAAGR